MHKCFKDDIQVDLLDRQPFKCGHKLLDHPALTLENLANVLPALPEDNVRYSKGLLATSANFESTFMHRPRDVSLGETIETLRTGDNYIMVSSPEVHPSFANLKRELLGSVEALIRARRAGKRAADAKLFLFIASPNSVTPFHIDRYSTLLMQFRGSKSVCVSEPWDERVVTPERCEAYITHRSTSLPWSPELDKLSTTYDFTPGEAIHIPFVAGHHVRNGAEDVSISMSIIFNTEESLRWRRALAFNDTARKYLKKVGASPAPVGHSRIRDGIKARAWASYAGLKAVAQRSAAK